MNRMETDFHNTQENAPGKYRYIDDVLFIWTHGEEKLKFFLVHPNIKFTHESNK